MLPTGNQSERGFSMVEPLVAMVVLTVSLLGAVGMFAVAQDGVTGGGKSLEAMALAESKMERLRALPYPALLTDGLSDGEAQAEPSTARLSSKGIVLIWKVRPDRPALFLSRAALIFVTAEWSERGGHRRTIRLGMRRANPVFGGGAS
jgi:prepilin-type N-terminal cleavage/methylation domain-containing protein